jgi:molecular chaperone GrpE
MAVYLLTQTVINCKPIDNMAKKNIKANEKEEKDTANKKPDTTEHKEHSPNTTRATSKSHPADDKKKQSSGGHKNDAGDSDKNEENSHGSDRKLSDKEKLSEMKDKYLRLSAEFDNYRKRTLKEKMDLTKTAGESIFLNLLPVMDDFDRALKMMENASDCKAMKEGIDLIHSKFREFFKQNGIKEIQSDSCDFDTDLHEAVTKIPAPEEKLKGKVVDTIQKGYYLHDKVIRYSKVVIGE